MKYFYLPIILLTAIGCGSSGLDASDDAAAICGCEDQITALSDEHAALPDSAREEAMELNSILDKRAALEECLNWTSVEVKERQETLDAMPADKQKEYNNALLKSLGDDCPNMVKFFR